VTTLSDLAALIEEEGDVSLFVDLEFSTRPDGLPALQEHYGFEVSEDDVMTGAPGASLLGLENHACDLAMVFGTDAAIAKNGWHVFADDQSFFPPYDLVPYVRTEVLDEYPEIEEIINELVGTFPWRRQTGHVRAGDRGPEGMARTQCKSRYPEDGA